MSLGIFKAACARRRIKSCLNIFMKIDINVFIMKK